MTLFQFRTGGPFPEPIISPYPGMSLFGGAGNGLDAPMRNDAVWACVRLLADSVSMMPLQAFTMRGGVRVSVPKAPRLLTNPSATMTTQEWVYAMMVSMLLRGNAFGQQVLWDERGFPLQVEPLSPDAVQVIQRAGEPVKYRISVMGRTEELGSDEVTHLRAFLMPGMLTGLSPIKYAAAATLTSMQVAAAFGTNFLSGGGHPSSILSTDKPINSDQALQLKERFMSSVKNRETAVLSNGLTWTSVQISPEESQFLETQKMGVNQIARIYGVPPERIGGKSENSMTYANVTQASLDFLTFSVQPWLTRLEAGISAMLPGDMHVRFDTSALVRMDAEMSARVDNIRLTGGVKTVDEVRGGIDLAPVPWGSEPFAMPKVTESVATELPKVLE